MRYGRRHDVSRSAEGQDIILAAADALQVSLSPLQIEHQTHNFPRPTPADFPQQTRYSRTQCTAHSISPHAPSSLTSQMRVSPFAPRPKKTSSHGVVYVTRRHAAHCNAHLFHLSPALTSAHSAQVHSAQC